MGKIMELDSALPHACVQEAERKQKREPRETAEELQECELVFSEF